MCNFVMIFFGVENNVPEKHNLFKCRHKILKNKASLTSDLQHIQGQTANEIRAFSTFIGKYGQCIAFFF